jgi:hypothetical protein
MNALTNINYQPRSSRKIEIKFFNCGYELQNSRNRGAFIFTVQYSRVVAIPVAFPRSWNNPGVVTKINVVVIIAELFCVILNICRDSS